MVYIFNPPIAQLVEHPPLKRLVVGSIPTGRTRNDEYDIVTLWASGGIGIRTSLRNWRSNPWEFDSPLAHTKRKHQMYLLFLYYVI